MVCFCSVWFLRYVFLCCGICCMCQCGVFVYLWSVFVCYGVCVKCSYMVLGMCAMMSVFV